MAVLLQYNFTSGLAASTVDSSVTGSIVTNNGLATLATATSLGYGTQPVLQAGPQDTITSASAAITADDFLYFTITPTSGNTISLTSLTFNIARGGASTPRGYDVRSSADNYAASLGTADVSTARPTFTGVTIDLSGAEFQNLTSTLSFRIYFYAPSLGNLFDIDDIIVNGSAGTGGTVQQEGFRFRADDGSETTATWLAPQDTNIIQEIETPTRLRVLLNSTNDRGSEQYRLEYREVGSPTWLILE